MWLLLFVGFADYFLSSRPTPAHPNATIRLVLELSEKYGIHEHSLMSDLCCSLSLCLSTRPCTHFENERSVVCHDTHGLCILHTVFMNKA